MSQKPRRKRQGKKKANNRRALQIKKRMRKTQKGGKKTKVFFQSENLPGLPPLFFFFLSLHYRKDSLSTCVCVCVCFFCCKILLFLSQRGGSEILMIHCSIQRWVMCLEILWWIVFRFGLFIVASGVRQGSILFEQLDLRRGAVLFLCIATFSLGITLMYVLGHRVSSTSRKSIRDQERSFWIPWIIIRWMETLVLILASVDLYYLAQRYQGWSSEVASPCYDATFVSLGWSAIPCHFSIVGDFYSRLSSWLWVWLILTAISACNLLM